MKHLKRFGQSSYRTYESSSAAMIDEKTKEEASKMLDKEFSPEKLASMSMDELTSMLNSASKLIDPNEKLSERRSYRMYENKDRADAIKNRFVTAGFATGVAGFFGGVAYFIMSRVPGELDDYGAPQGLIPTAEGTLGAIGILAIGIVAGLVIAKIGEGIAEKVAREGQSSPEY
jgi:hypothetical protein